MIPLFLSFFECMACQKNPPSTRAFPLCNRCKESILFHPTHLISPDFTPYDIQSLYTLYALYEESYDVLKKWKLRHSPIFDRHVLVLPPSLKRKLKNLHADAIVPIPQNPDRLWKIESQTEKIAFWLSRQIQVPVRPWLKYENPKHTPKQSSQSALDRKTSIPPMTAEKSSSLSGKTILMVDDFFTSGRTLQCGAQHLRRGQALQVHGFCLGMRLSAGPALAKGRNL